MSQTLCPRCGQPWCDRNEAHDHGLPQPEHGQLTQCDSCDTYLQWAIGEKARLVPASRARIQAFAKLSQNTPKVDVQGIISYAIDYLCTPLATDENGIHLRSQESF